MTDHRRATSKIIGIGLSRTGTTRLHGALVLLGYPAVHAFVRRTWIEGDFQTDVLGDYDAITDLIPDVGREQMLESTGLVLVVVAVDKSHPEIAFGAGHLAGWPDQILYGGPAGAGNVDEDAAVGVRDHTLKKDGRRSRLENSCGEQARSRIAKGVKDASVS